MTVSGAGRKMEEQKERGRKRKRREGGGAGRKRTEKDGIWRLTGVQFRKNFNICLHILYKDCRNERVKKKKLSNNLSENC